MSEETCKALRALSDLVNNAIVDFTACVQKEPAFHAFREEIGTVFDAMIHLKGALDEAADTRRE